MSARDIAAALGGARRSGSGWVCRCPAHNDKNPSLSIKDGRNGRVHLHCFAGCESRDVHMALVARGLYPMPEDHDKWSAEKRDALALKWRQARELYEDGAPLGCIAHRTNLSRQAISEKASDWKWRIGAPWSQRRRNKAAEFDGGDWNDRVP